MTSATSGTSGSTITQELELVYWKDVKESNDTHDLEGFLKRFPEGVYSDLAKRQLKRIADAKLAQGESLYDSTQIAPMPKAESVELADDITMLHRPDALKNLDPTPHNNEPDLETTAPMASGPGQDLDDTMPQPPGVNAPEPATGLPAMPPGLQASPEQLDDTLIKITKQAPNSKETAAEIDAPVQKPKRGGVGLMVGAAAMAFIAIGAWLWMAVAKSPDVNVPVAVVSTPTLTVTAVVAVPVEPASSPFSQLEATTVSVSIANTSSVASPPSTEPLNAGLPVLTSSPSLSTVGATTTAVKTPKLAASSAKATKAQRDAAATQSGQPANPANKPTTTAVNSATVPSPTAAASAAPAPKPVAAAPSSPREACEGRVLFGFASCLTEQCNKSTYQNHPVCVERREQEDRRKASELNR
jgi:eukaryotic-like serine/threonine-protein kinase